MASLTHPNLIRVFDSGDANGLTYMVMEYVPGKSLHHSAHGKAIDPRQAAQIIIAACEGLAHAHGCGIVHGAIKPTDILLTPKCEPKIGNFGFARHVPSEATAYMAPELADGRVSGTPQSDVYAIGVILRELLTGIPAASADAERVVIHDLRLADICRKATHPEPALRHADAVALAKALKAWMSSGVLKTATRPRQVPAHRPKPVALPRPTPRPGLVMLKHCAVIGFLLVAIHSLWGVYQEKQETLARLQQAEDAKPRVIIVKADAVEQTPRVIDTAIVQWDSEP
jgi:serine/threonine protein kinase